MAPSWSNIPDDIISLFINNISYVDQIRFQAVCKNWREAAMYRIAKSADRLPWIMAYSSFSCFLYDPSHRQRYTVCSNDTSREKTFTGAEVLDSKYGWVLFSQNSSTSLFFYDPFIDKIVQPPKLELTTVHVATFSTTPVSSDCLIFVLMAEETYSPSGPGIRICICKPGDAEWSELLFKCSYLAHVTDVEYVDGVFYCTFTKYAIGAFDVALKEWKMHPYPYAHEILHTGITERLTECDGDLLLSQCLYDRLNRFGSFQTWRILKLDRSQMSWFQIESLENISLFLSDACISIPVEKGRELADILDTHYRCLAAPRNQPLCPQISEIYKWRVEGSIKKCWIQTPDPKFTFGTRRNQEDR